MLATAENAAFFFFRGQNLNTWRSKGPAWKVDKDAVLAPPPAGQPAELISNLHVEADFHLTVWVNPGEKGRGAILFRDTTQPDLPVAPRVEFTAGKPLALAGVEAEGVVPKYDNPVKPGAWNKLEIIVAGDSLQVKLNDKDALIATKPRLPRRRAVALQIPAAADENIRFSRLDIKLLVKKE